MTSAPVQSAKITETQKLFLEFESEYDSADELCKQVQLFRQEAGIPAINEMRYAGYHLRQALSANAQIGDIDQLRKAKSHAQRACYEAAEAGLVLALKEIHLFRDDYKTVVVTGDIKDYVDILTKSQEAQRRLGVARQTGDNQTLDHIKHKELFVYLSQAANTLHAARPEINKRMLETRTARKRWIATTTVAVLALIVAASAFVYNVANSSKSSALPAASTPSTPATPGGGVRPHTP